MSSIENDVIAAFRVGGGYFNTDHVTYPEDAMAPGSQNVLITDNNAQRIFKGLDSNGTGGRVMFPVAGGYASLNDYSSVTASGSIFNFINESMFAIGAGRVYYNGAQLVDSTPAPTNVTATSTLQLSPKVGAYTYPEWYTAGFSQPTAPTVRARNAVSPFEGKMTGTYSFKIAAVRSTTGARSIASVTSAVIVTEGQTAHLTFPAAATNGQDRWAIFGTKAGFGGVGVHYLIEEIDEADLSTIDSIARSYVLEYNDSDLLPVTAYIDDYPPQAALFAARLENYVLTFGAYDNAIQCSIRNYPESFHPDHLAFLPKAPTAILQEPQGSYIYVSTESSVHAVSVIPSVDNPMIVQTLWSDVGVANHHNWCTVDGVLFAFTGKTGAVTMGNNGSPSSAFAMPVAKAMRDWTVDNVVVHRVPHLNSVAYSYLNETYLFNLQTLKWSSPAALDGAGQIVSALVVDRTPYVCLDDLGTFTMYEFDSAGDFANTQFAIHTPHKIVNPQGRINILGIRAVFCAHWTEDFDFDLYTDFSGTPDETLTHTAASIGMQTTVRSRWYVPRKNSVAVSMSAPYGTGKTNDAYLSHILVYGTLESSTTL